MKSIAILIISTVFVFSGCCFGTTRDIEILVDEINSQQVRIGIQEIIIEEYKREINWYNEREQYLHDIYREYIETIQEM